MANGIWGFCIDSREGELCANPPSGPYIEALGPVEVGDGKTSLSLEGGSFLSFHIPVPHGNVEVPGARPMTEGVACGAQGPVPVSTEGVLGFDPVGDMELLAKDPFLGRLMGWDVSFNHEERRTGFGGCAGGCESVWR
jgi:hypothetical protein